MSPRRTKGHPRDEDGLSLGSSSADKAKELNVFLATPSVQRVRTDSLLRLCCIGLECFKPLSEGRELFVVPLKLHKMLSAFDGLFLLKVFCYPLCVSLTADDGKVWRLLIWFLLEPHCFYRMARDTFLACKDLLS